MTRAMTILAFLTLSACSSEMASYCDGIQGEDNQLACLNDVSDQLRLDLDSRIDREADRAADRVDDVRDRGDDAHRELDRIRNGARGEVRDGRSDGERGRSVRDGIRDMEREIDRADRDMRDLADEGREDDERGRDDDDSRRE
jgi:hypothetical protein